MSTWGMGLYPSGLTPRLDGVAVRNGSDEGDFVDQMHAFDHHVADTSIHALNLVPLSSHCHNGEYYMQPMEFRHNDHSYASS